MYQTRTCSGPDCTGYLTAICTPDAPLNNWTNQGCSGDSCTSDQMYQTSPTLYNCYTAEQCVNDSCQGWSNTTCGGGGCLPSQMQQTRTCTLGCAATSQCVDLTLGSPQNFSVNPTLGNGDQLFTLSWDSPDSLTCPVDPLSYALAYDDINNFSETVSITSIQRGPFSHGNHTVWVKAQDNSGRQSSPVAVTFEADALGPEAPVCYVCP